MKRIHSMAPNAPRRLSRRDALRLGLGAAMLGMLGLPRKARADAKAKACILLYMEGGPSQLDTWDPKPGQANGGPYQAIETAVPGLRISEHLPLLAARAKQLAVVRSLTCKEGNHQRARHLMHAGYAPAGGADHPALGSLVAKSRGISALPGYVSIGGPGEDAGLLGAAWAPFPVPNPGGPLKFLELPKNVDSARFDRRFTLQQQLDTGFAAMHPGALVAGRRAVADQAVAMMRSPATQALRIDSASEAYGDGPFGKGCLVARQLVEAGVPFVEVAQRGWDTHKDNFATVKTLSAELDRAMSALLDDLAARGLLSTTLVVWMGDFGRTPRINADGGRDHFPQVSSVVLAGGGLRTGTVVGETSADGMEIRARPVTVPDLFRTLAVQLGLDPDDVNESSAGRPIKVVDGGSVISEIA